MSIDQATRQEHDAPCAEGTDNDGTPGYAPRCPGPILRTERKPGPASAVNIHDEEVAARSRWPLQRRVPRPQPNPLRTARCQAHRDPNQDQKETRASLRWRRARLWCTRLGCSEPNHRGQCSLLGSSRARYQRTTSQNQGSRFVRPRTSAPSVASTTRIARWHTHPTCSADKGDHGHPGDFVAMLKVESRSHPVRPDTVIWNQRCSFGPNITNSTAST